VRATKERGEARQGEPKRCGASGRGARAVRAGIGWRRRGVGRARLPADFRLHDRHLCERRPADRQGTPLDNRRADDRRPDHQQREPRPRHGSRGYRAARLRAVSRLSEPPALALQGLRPLPAPLHVGSLARPAPTTRRGSACPTRISRRTSAVPSSRTPSRSTRASAQARATTTPPRWRGSS
jgi:hypothetical protein